MRAGSVAARAGAVSGGAGHARPTAVDRVVDAIAGLFNAGATVNFAPVDGVYKAETNPDGRATGLTQQQRVQATRADAPIRLYNARAREIYMQAPVLGSMIDERA
jgi:hypothetical protein